MAKLRLSTLLRLAAGALLVVAVFALYIEKLGGRSGPPVPESAQLPLPVSEDSKRTTGSSKRDQLAGGGAAGADASERSANTEDAEDGDDAKEAPQVEWVKTDPEQQEDEKRERVQRVVEPVPREKARIEEVPKPIMPRPQPARAEDIDIATTPDASDAPIDIIEAQAEGAASAGPSSPVSAKPVLAPALPTIPAAEGSCQLPTLALAIKSGQEVLLSRMPLIQSTWLPKDLCNVVVISGSAGSEEGVDLDDNSESTDESVKANEFQQTIGSLTVLDVVTNVYSAPKADTPEEEKKGVLGSRFEIKHKYRLEVLKADKGLGWEDRREWGTTFPNASAQTKPSEGADSQDTAPGSVPEISKMPAADDGAGVAAAGKKASPKVAEGARRSVIRAGAKSIAVPKASKDPSGSARLRRRHAHGQESATNAPHHHSDSRAGGGTDAGWEADANKNLPGFVELWNRFPDADWFFMIDDDTFLSVPTLVQTIIKNPRWNSEFPYFLGSAYVFSGCPHMVDGKTVEEGVFAQGGAGMLISRGGMKKLLGVVAKCMEDLWECWAGDVRTAICLKTAGVELTELPHEDVGAGGFWGSFSEDVARWPHGSPCDPLITLHHVTEPQQLHRLTLAAEKLGPNVPFTFSAAYPAVARVVDHKTLVAEEGVIRKSAWREGAEVARIEVGPKFTGPLRNVSVVLAPGKAVVEGAKLANFNIESKYEGSNDERHALLCALACHQACTAHELCTSWTLDVAAKPDSASSKRICILQGNLSRAKGPGGAPEIAPAKWEFTEDEKKENSRLTKEHWNGLAVPWTGVLFKGLRKWLDLGATCADKAKKDVKAVPSGS